MASSLTGLAALIQRVTKERKPYSMTVTPLGELQSLSWKVELEYEGFESAAMSKRRKDAVDIAADEILSQLPPIQANAATRLAGLTPDQQAKLVDMLDRLL